MQLRSGLPMEAMFSPCQGFHMVRRAAANDIYILPQDTMSVIATRCNVTLPALETANPQVWLFRIVL